MIESGVNLPLSSAAAAVTTLKVEPGRVAGLRRAVEERLGPRRCSAPRSGPGTSFGSYSGTLTITRTRPVCGSRATIAPCRPPSASQRGALRRRGPGWWSRPALAGLGLQLGEDRAELVLLARELVVAGALESRRGRASMNE